MILLINPTKKRRRSIQRTIGEAFVTNELFREFGSIGERRPLVMRYMSVYVDFVLESKALYATDDGAGFIGLQYSENAPVLPQIKMLCRLFTSLPFSKIRKMLRHIRQIADTNKKYAEKPHIDILMAAVRKKAQGKGYATQLVRFAQDMAAQKNVPLLADTDMKQYAEMYRHLGFRLYHRKTASNGVTRYNLVWIPAAYRSSASDSAQKG